MLAVPHGSVGFEVIILMIAVVVCLVGMGFPRCEDSVNRMAGRPRLTLGSTAHSTQASCTSRTGSPSRTT
jgi:hypothetical protein